MSLGWAAAQRAFVEHATRVLHGDDRIVAAWLTGSLAEGTGDPVSDVDLRIAVHDEIFRQFVEGWTELIDRLGPTVLRRRIGTPDDPIVTAVTPEWLRFDIAIQRASDDRPRSFAVAVPLFAREEVEARLLLRAPSGAEASARLLATDEEFLRVLGLLPVVVAREEYVVGMDGVGLLRRMLIDLLLIESGRPRAGALRLNPLLTEEARAVLVALPWLAPTRDAVVQGHAACARAFLPRARRLVEAAGQPYPEELERAACLHLKRTLGMAL